MTYFTTTVYPHDSWNKGGSTTTIHIIDPSGIELATIEGNGLSTTTVHQDHLGSTNVLTTNTGILKEVSKIGTVTINFLRHSMLDLI